MVIGILTFELHIPGCRSLKEKRFHTKSMKTRIANKFNVAIAETDHHDLWQRARFSAVTVATERRFANQVLSKVVDVVQNNGSSELIDYGITFI